MSSNEEYVDALYSSLRSRDVKLTYTELEDSLREAADAQPKLDPQPYWCPEGERCGRPHWDTVFKPRAGYSQNEKDYS